MAQISASYIAPSSEELWVRKEINFVQTLYTPTHMYTTVKAAHFNSIRTYSIIPYQHHRTDDDNCSHTAEHNEEYLPPDKSNPRSSGSRSGRELAAGLQGTIVEPDQEPSSLMLYTSANKSGVEIDMRRWVYLNTSTTYNIIIHYGATYIELTSYST